MTFEIHANIVLKLGNISIEIHNVVRPGTQIALSLLFRFVTTKYSQIITA